jgi:4-hydroxy-tetrahydrodipicolinate synthase
MQGAAPGFRVWSGNDSDSFPLLAMGGYGVVSVVAHLTGRQVKAMFEKFLAGDVTGAAAIHHELLPLVNALFITTSPIPVKYMLNQVGFNVGGLRLPLVDPDEKTAASIRETLARYNVDLPVAMPA